VYYTYVLFSEKDGKHYTGYTSNLKLRPARLNDSENQNRRFYLTGLKQHQKGKGLNLIQPTSGQIWTNYLLAFLPFYVFLV